MLQLKNISKKYITGDFVQHALDDISLTFRDNEFVAILGPSGSGKTTLLNIIGGLDRYNKGDLIISDVSTKKYKDKDWDSYRNHSIGFVFQSYNLIPHQTILANVELALTISGMSKKKRRKLAIEALDEVGLKEHINKKPNQLSGGQMQRVAIARALINNPDILLADEPTGALDSTTSIQVMELLKEVAKKRLVIMVTHNPELADKYATRIVNLQDGKITGDTDPVLAIETESIHKNLGKTSMNFLTALSLSFNNLRTKKGRTILTAFAGSIGIIGIALILSLSNGTQKYIDKIQESTLSQYPLTIQDQNVDYTSILSSLMDLNSSEDKGKSKNNIKAKPIINDLIAKMTNKNEKNDMKEIKKWLESNPDNIKKYVSSIEYNYNSTLNVYKSDTTDGIVKANPSDIFEIMGLGSDGQSTQALTMGSNYSQDIWVKSTYKDDALKEQFDILSGKLPTKDNEVAIVVNNNQISDYTLYTLGIYDKQELKKAMSDGIAGEEVNIINDKDSWTYDELLNLDYTMVPEAYKYQKQNNIWVNMSEDEAFMKDAISNGYKLKVCGVLKANSETIYDSPWGFVLYTQGLSDKLLDMCNNSEIYNYQKEHKDIDIFTNLPFSVYKDNQNFTMDDLNNYLASASAGEQAQINAFIQSLKSQGKSDDEVLEVLKEQFARQNDITTYDTNMEKIGAANLDKPNSINIYPVDFEAKEKIDEIIKDYNQKQEDSKNLDKQVHYTDIVGTMMKSVTNIINAITYILVAFVAISLIVSSIMIGIITYISVLERTKEIGILRSLGASKKNVSHVFNAETVIIGFLSGIIGIGISLLLTIPINKIIYALTNNENMKAVLPINASLILIVLSIILTLIGGLIPSKKAAKQDPVTALRTE